MIVVSIPAKKKLKTPRDFYYDWHFKRKRKRLEKANEEYKFFLGNQIASKFNIECYNYLFARIGDYSVMSDLFKNWDVARLDGYHPNVEITMVLDDPTVRQRKDYKFDPEDETEPCLIHIHAEDYVYALTHWDEYMKDAYKDLDHYYGHLYKKKAKKK